ncbi:MAG: molybdopterin-dependent oxidoreductase [Chloroflexi bacterium]|nr:molybdopterin-dependent oxidoreductase [Chloroflexota bacterium]
MGERPRGARAGGGVSPAVAMGDIFVDYTPGPIVKAAIEALGTRDKPALLAAVSLGALAVGALLGPAAGRRRWVGSAAFVAFGAIGVIAVARDPLTGTLIALVIAAAAAGWLALRLVLNAAFVADSAVAPAAQMPGRGIASRRRFLAFASGGATAAAFAAFAGRRLIGPAVDVDAQRAEITLPDVANATASTAPGDLALPGISPLVTPNKDFYRIDTALVVPRVDAASWRLRVTGMVDHPFELTYDELLPMTSTEQTITLACVSNEVGGHLVGNARWRGVPLPELLARAGVQSGATQIVGRSVDDVTVGFPTDVALDGPSRDGRGGDEQRALPAAHGFPARLVVPGLYGYVSATKWLQEIELTTLEGFDAYWIPRGWAKQAPIKTQSRIDVPRVGRSLAAGRVAIAGVAWRGVGRRPRHQPRRGECAHEGRRRRTRVAGGIARPGALEQQLAPVGARVGRRARRLSHRGARDRRRGRHADGRARLPLPRRRDRASFDHGARAQELAGQRGHGLVRARSLARRSPPASRIVPRQPPRSTVVRWRSRTAPAARGAATCNFAR